MSAGGQNKVAAEPQLSDLLDLWKRDVFLNLNCHAIGTIQSFNSAARSVSITINYKKVFLVQKTPTGPQSEIYKDYPILLDVPVIILGGGAFKLTFPISIGDQCLVLFNDRDIDSWVAGSNSSPPNSSRLHSFADGVALIGFGFAGSYDTTHALLSNGQTQVGVSSTKVRAANATHTLNGVLQDLITTIKAIVVNTGTGALSPGSVAALSVIATEVGSLLE